MMRKLALIGFGLVVWVATTALLTGQQAANDAHVHGSSDAWQIGAAVASLATIAVLGLSSALARRWHR